jgi:transcriptional regulator
MEGIAAQMAMTQQAIALSVMRQTSDMQQKMADILMESALTVAASSRGGMLDISA